MDPKIKRRTKDNSKLKILLSDYKVNTIQELANKVINNTSIEFELKPIDEDVDSPTKKEKKQKFINKLNEENNVTAYVKDILNKMTWLEI